jgi:hypothetical protein
VARSAPIQRFGKASAELLQAVFERAVSRLPLPDQEEVTNKLSMFDQVLADDGSMLMDIILNCCRQQNHKRARRKWGDVL